MSLRILEKYVSGSLAVFFACALSMSVCAADRTVTYEVPYTGDVLANIETGTLTIDQSESEISEENALSFTGFEATAESTTVFKGGWWDFGGGNFPVNDADDRVIVFDGTVVTNIASMPYLEYFRNKFRILGGSKFYVTGNAVIDAGTSTSDRKNELYVAEGSTFIAGGSIIMGYKNNGNNSHRNERSRFEVTGEGSYVKAANLNLNYAGATGSPGGYTAVVTNNAKLDITGTINLDGGVRTFNNKFYVIDGGVVTAKEVNVGTSYKKTYDNSSCGHGVYILNGGRLRATSEFKIGYTSSSHAGQSGMSLVISNGSFSAAKFLPFGIAPGNSNSIVRISGPQAEFKVDDIGNWPLFNSAGWNRFVVENGAHVRLPWRNYGYTSAAANSTLLVTGEGTKLTLDYVLGLASGRDDSETCTGYTNSLCVADGAVVTGGIIRVAGDAGKLSVSNATVLLSADTGYDEVPYEPIGNFFHPALTAGVRFSYGGRSTNCVIELSGTSPRIACLNNASAHFKGSTKLVFNIPETGYDYGENDYVPLDVANRLTVEDNCSMELNGLESKVLRKTIGANGGSLRLVRAGTINVGDAFLESAAVSLPEGYSLSLDVIPQEGAVLSLEYRAPGLIMTVR